VFNIIFIESPEKRDLRMRPGTFGCESKDKKYKKNDGEALRDHSSATISTLNTVPASELSPPTVMLPIPKPLWV
jgi:hypothetical protein